MGSEHRAGLERLGVLIGRTRSKTFGDSMFLVLGSEPPRVPESMIETQRLDVLSLSSMLDV